MLATMLKQGVAAVMGLTLAAPTGLVAAPVQTQPGFAPGDGAVSPAACTPLGFDLSGPPQRSRPVPAPPPSPRANAGPPPITLPIEPTRKQDRVEYAGPPVIVPGPPPPPAPPAPARPSVITNPQWSRRPQVTERDFPDRAISSGTSGSATVRCTAQANGRPTACQVVSEDPSGYGFGRAAVRVVERGQLSPRTVDGAAQNATFTATVRFPIADE